MRILRAPTSDKREIFRRLFNTEIFDKIVSRLGERNSQYREELQNVLRRCQTKAEDVVVPENFPQQAEMKELVQKIRKDKMPSLVDFERLQTYLNEAGEVLAREAEKATAEAVAAQKRYDAENHCNISHQLVFYCSITLNSHNKTIGDVQCRKNGLDLIQNHKVR